MNKIVNRATLILTTIIFSIIFIFSLFMQSNVAYNQNHLMSLIIIVPIFILIIIEGMMILNDKRIDKKI